MTDSGRPKFPNVGKFAKNALGRIASSLSKCVDKLLHFLVCYGATLTLIYLLGWRRWPNAVLFAAGLSFGKEFADEFLYKGFDWKDLLADFLGIAFAMLVMVLEVFVL